LSEFAEMSFNVPQIAQASTGVWKLEREDFPVRGRPEGMLLRLFVAALVLLALAGACADLMRGRRPLLLG
jgi:hypothetical protein